MLLGWGLVAQTNQNGRDIGVLGVIVVLALVHRRRRPRKDREDRLFLSPSGIEAMQRRDQKKP
jgi:hypothetical protein